QSEMETTTVQISTAGVSRKRTRTRILVGSIIGITIALTAVYTFLIAPARNIVPSIAVQPFTEIGSEDASFGNYLALEIWGRLASIGSIELREFYTSEEYQYSGKAVEEIGRDFNVRYLLKANYQLETTSEGVSRIRCTPRLLDTKTASTVWTPTNQYVYEGIEILELQASLVEQVISSLDVVLSSQEKEAIKDRPTESLEAYSAFQEAIQVLSNPQGQEDRELGMNLLARAVRLDSTFALAWANLGELYGSFAYLGQVQDVANYFQKAQQAVDMALRYGPDLAETYSATGLLYYRRDLDYLKAIDQFDVALRLQPNNGRIIALSAYSYRRAGKWEEAIQRLEKAVQLDPLTSSHLLNLSGSYLSNRQYVSAKKSIEQYLTINPNNISSHFQTALLPLLSMGDISESRSVLEKLPEDILRQLVRSGGITNYRRILLRVHADFFRPLLIMERPFITYEPDSPGRYILGNHYIARAETEWALGNINLATAYWDSLIYHKDYEWEPRSYRGWIDAQLMAEYGKAKLLTGDISRGLELGRQAVEFYPISMDAEHATEITLDLAEIYVMANEPEKAIALLDTLLSIPALLSIHMLKVDPIWNPLRDHPRFQALLEKYKQ
ncbi:tetratricopeptide repeat protein, partial [Gemmatimonadota bacterium]